MPSYMDAVRALRAQSGPRAPAYRECARLIEELYEDKAEAVRLLRALWPCVNEMNDEGYKGDLPGEIETFLAKQETSE